MKFNSLIFDSDICNISNESDVEQKIVLPFLITPSPEGLGLLLNDIVTKANIAQYESGKRTKKRVLYPDFLVLKRGIPLLIVEVKGPGEKLEDAWAESQEYAFQVNLNYESAVNPVQYIIATNGREFWVGLFDAPAPELKVLIDDLGPHSLKLQLIQKMISNKILEEKSKKYHSKIFPLEYKKAIEEIGSSAVQNELIKNNDFRFQMDSVKDIFNPETQKQRSYIATKGYISIDSNIKSGVSISKIVKSRSDHISQSIDRNNPANLISALADDSIYEGDSTIILIGRVGSGKSTFVDYLQLTDTLPPELSKSITWVRLDLNKAPLNKDHLFTWVSDNIVQELKKGFEAVDFEELDQLEKIYAPQINSFKKGVGRLFGDENSLEYKQEIGKIILGEESDPLKKAQAYTRYLVTEKRKFLIIVFDNSDKKDVDSQLLMFDVANWTKTEFRAVVMLPLRDETYNRYADRPPLDTAIKSLTFKIEPPSFTEVLKKRVELAIERMQIKSASKQQNAYFSNSNYRLTYKVEQEADYLRGMLKSIFNEQNRVGSLITKLAGGNIRRALEIFVNLCTSGHIPAQEIFKSNLPKHEELPFGVVLKALMKADRYFYRSDDSFIKNIFDLSDIGNESSFFLRALILNLLSTKKDKSNSYIAVRSIIDQLSLYSIDESIIMSEIKTLVLGWCIDTEDFSNNVCIDTRIRISSAGETHLFLAGDPIYVATVSEDTYLSKKNDNLINDIKYHMSKLREQKYSNGQVEFEYANNLAINFLDELVTYRQSISDNIGIVYTESFKESYNTICLIENFRDRVVDKSYSRFLGVQRSFFEENKKGDILKGKISNIAAFGIFVLLASDEFRGEVSGVIHKDTLARDKDIHYYIENSSEYMGKEIEIEILSLNLHMQRVSLKMV